MFCKLSKEVFDKYRCFTNIPLVPFVYYSKNVLSRRSSHPEVFCKTEVLEGYLCNKVALDVLLIIFFVWRNNNTTFSRYLDFCVLLKADFKICEVIIDMATKWKLNLCLLFLNPKCYQNKIWSYTNLLYYSYCQYIFDQCSRLKTSSRPFYNFIKMTI